MKNIVELIRKDVVFLGAFFSDDCFERFSEERQVTRRSRLGKRY
jgi:hypothetical protein